MSVEPGRLRILSFNIRYAEARDGRNSWPNRRRLVAEILGACRPDLAGFQEVLFDQLEDLRGMLPDYGWLGLGRDDGRKEGEFAPLFFRRQSVERSGHFWLSDTPERPGNGWGGQKRICTWASFAGRPGFTLFNTHLESDAAQARARSVPLLLRKMRELAAAGPVFLIGDLNFKPNSAEYRQLAREMRDSYRESRGGGPSRVSSHSFTGRKRNLLWRWRGEGRIDYIWVRGEVRVLDSRILSDAPAARSGIWPSDHWPILCEVLLGPG